jgi:yeast amino acid transporter
MRCILHLTLGTYTCPRFYIGGVTIIGLLVPSNDPRLGLSSNNGTAAASPFVIAINHAGIKVLPSIINAALLTSGNAIRSVLICVS